MRILFIINFYPPGYWGSISQQCKATVDFLIEKQHNVYILTGNYGATGQEKLQIAAKLPMRNLKYVNYENSNSFERWKLDKYNYKITKKVATVILPDIVFFWDLDGVSVAPVLAIQDLHILKVFEISNLWIDKYIHPEFLAKLKLNLKKLLPQVVGGEIDFNPSIVNTIELKEEMTKRYKLERSHLLPRGVKISTAEQTPDFNSKINFVYNGVIDRNKDFTEIFKVLQRFRKQGKIFTYNLFGKVETSFIYVLKKDLIKFDLEDQVRFHDFTENKNIMYEQNQIYLIPSGKSIDLEHDIFRAWSHKRLLLLPAKSADRLVQDGVNGLIYDDDLLEKLEWIFANPVQASKICETEYQIVEENYNLDKIMEQTEKILLEELMIHRRKHGKNI